MSGSRGQRRGAVGRNKTAGSGARSHKLVAVTASPTSPAVLADVRRDEASLEWLTPALFRFGASSLLGGLLMQRRTQLEGHYSGQDYATVE